MDPITAALVAGIAAGATQLGQSAVSDAYNSVKALIKRKFGKTNLPVFIDDLENNPEDTDLQKVVQKKIESTNVDKDPELQEAVQKLLEAIHQVQTFEPEGDNIQISAGGDIVFAKDSGKAIQVKNSQVGVIGDNTKISGGIHYKNQK